MNLLLRIRKFLHWEKTPKPSADLLPELYTHLKPFRLPLIMTVMTMMVGAVGYVMIDDFTLMDAIYQTGITFTTVGFGEIAPISDAGRIFTITLIILGFAVFTSAVGTLVSELNKGNISAILKERRMLYKIVRLKKHFVICYHNEYTIEVTKQLRENHIPFVVMDPREEIHQWAEEYKYTTYLQAEPHAELSMLKANLSSAVGMITLSDSVADNIALIASVRLFEKEHELPNSYNIIAIAQSASEGESLKKLGADTVISPTKITAKRVSAMAARPDMVNLLEEFLYTTENPLDMEEIFIPKYSWAVLKKIKETNLRDITNTSIIGITKKGGKFTSMPKGDVLITSESKVLVIGTLSGIEQTKALFMKKEKPKELRFV